MSAGSPCRRWAPIRASGPAIAGLCAAAALLSAGAVAAAPARTVAVSVLDRPSRAADRLPAAALRNIADLGARTFSPLPATVRLAARSRLASYYVAANRPGGVCLVVSARRGRSGQISCDRGAGFRKDGALYLGGPYGRDAHPVMVGLVPDGYDRVRLAAREARVSGNVFVLPVGDAPGGALALSGPGRRRSIDLASVHQVWLRWDVRERPGAPRTQAR